MTSAGPRLGQRQQQIRLVLVLLVLVVAAYGAYRQSRVQRPEAHQPAAGAAAKVRPSKAAEESSRSRQHNATAEFATTIVNSQTIFDLDGEVVYQGDVDLSKTLSRIESGKLLRFGNDGSTFQNRERRLPRKPAGYYKEYVHPTPGLSGPGPQRIVVGQEGEVYYTPDHYATFQRVDK